MGPGANYRSPFHPHGAILNGVVRNPARARLVTLCFGYLLFQVSARLDAKREALEETNQ